MNLVDLPQDALLKLFTFCRVVDVLKIERTCTYFRELVASRDIWLHFVNNHRFDEAPDLPMGHPLTTISTSELRKVVINAVRGKYNWTSHRPCPTDTRSIHVLNNAWPFSFHFVPGRRYLLEYSGHFEQNMFEMTKIFIACFDLSSKKLTATFYSRITGSIPSFDFRPNAGMSFEQVDSTILRAAHCVFHRDNSELIIEVVEFNLSEGVSTLVFSTTLPMEHVSSKGRFWEIALCKSFAFVSTQLGILAVDWMSRKWVMLMCDWELNMKSMRTTYDSLFMCCHSDDDLELSIAPFGPDFSAIARHCTSVSSPPAFLQLNDYISSSIRLPISSIPGTDWWFSINSLYATLHGSSLASDYHGPGIVVDTVSVLMDVYRTDGVSRTGNHLTAFKIYLLKDNNPEEEEASGPSLSISLQKTSCPIALCNDNIIRGEEKDHWVSHVSRSGRFVCMLKWVNGGRATYHSHAMSITDMWESQAGVVCADTELRDECSSIVEIDADNFYLDLHSGAICLETWLDGDEPAAEIRYFD